MSCTQQHRDDARSAHRWKSRWYLGDPHQIRRARHELVQDLSFVPGVEDEVREALTLCLSEMFTIALVRALRAERGLVVFRSLALRHPEPHRRVLRLSVGERGSPLSWDAPTGWSHQERTDAPGLTLIDHFANRWGSRRVRGAEGEWAHLVWVEFDIGFPTALGEAA